MADVAADIALFLLNGRSGAGLSVHAFIDAQSLYDSASATGSIEEPAAVAGLHDHFRWGTLASVMWLPAHLQISDGLTKPTGASTLRSAVASGWLSLPRSSCLTKLSLGAYGSLA